MLEETIEATPEEAIPSTTDGVEETPAVQEETPASEPEVSPEPGSIEYTKAVEERIGKVTGARHRAEAERDLYKSRVQELENQVNTPNNEQVNPAPTSTFSEAEPVEASFEDYNVYIKNLASWQFRKENADYQATTAVTEAKNRTVKMESDFKTKVNSSGITTDHPDFYEKIRFVNLVPHVQEAVLTSDKGPELALHLANNPEIMRDLNLQPPLVAARQLGAIEAKLSGKVEKKTVSTTPTPLTPVNTDTSAVTDDNPKDINDWMQKRKEREIAKIERKLSGKP